MKNLFLKMLLSLVCTLELSVGAEVQPPLQRVNFEPANSECHEMKEPISWKYCVYTPKNGKINGEVAYFLHGRNLNELAWNDDSFYTAMIQQYWQNHNLKAPTIVSVSFGPLWVLAPKGQASKSGLLELFAQLVIPTIEAKMATPSKRILFGESMGGLNSLIAGLKTVGLFQKVASICPPVYKISPFDSDETIKEFIDRTGADPVTMSGVIMLAKAFFADEVEWQNSSPTQFIEKLNVKTAPQLYLSCGLYDKYGNYEGAEYLASRAAAKGLNLEWRPQYGGHCVVDVPSLAEFLVK